MLTERHDPAPDRTKEVDESVQQALELADTVRAELRRNGNGRIIARAIAEAVRCEEFPLRAHC